MWNWLFRRSKPTAEQARDDFDDFEDLEGDEELIDAAALRIIARHIAAHDGELQPNGACIDRLFVVSPHPFAA